MRVFKKRQIFVALVGISLISLVFLGLGCDGGGGGGGAVVDPCAGIPCLTENWGNTYYEFVDQWGDPVIVTSNGVEAGGGGIYYDDLGDPYPIALAGPVIDCYNSELTYGAIDWNWNGIVDPGEELASVEGNVNYSGGTLTIYNLVLEGIPVEDIVATCVGPGVFGTDILVQEDGGFPANLFHELARILSIE